jgi:PmbA protein
VLIENGVLQFFMETVDSASRRGTLANGYDGGLHVIKLRGERGHAVELAQRAGTPTLCVHRFSGNIDPITGDYSGTAKNSHLIRNGEITPITETMIAGNLFELLNNIVAVGAVENIGNRMEAPPMLIDGVSVSAGAETG